MGKHSEEFEGIDVAKHRNAIAVAPGCRISRVENTCLQTHAGTGRQGWLGNQSGLGAAQRGNPSLQIEPATM